MYIDLYHDTAATESIEFEYFEIDNRRSGLFDERHQSISNIYSTLQKYKIFSQQPYSNLKYPTAFIQH